MPPTRLIQLGMTTKTNRLVMMVMPRWQEQMTRMATLTQKSKKTRMPQLMRTAMPQRAAISQERMMKLMLSLIIKTVI